VNWPFNSEKKKQTNILLREKQTNVFLRKKHTKKKHNTPTKNFAVFFVASIRVLEEDVVGQSLRRFKNFKAFQRQDSFFSPLKDKVDPDSYRRNVKPRGMEVPMKIVWLLILEGTSKNYLFPKMYGWTNLQPCSP